MNSVKILSIENDTHNVFHIKTEKPEDFSFKPGQAADVALDQSEWKDEIRPFTFTSLPSDDYLGFHIKSYPEHHSVTEQIAKLNQGDSLLIGDIYGAIEYQDEGIFIAGGAGVTPFISILKDLKANNKLGNNKLIFANNTSADIIENDFFTELLGKHFINVLSEEEKDGYEHGHITKDIIKNQILDDNSYFYLCGPPPMMEAVLEQFDELGIDKSRIVKEDF